MCFYIEGMGKDLQDCFSAYPVYRANSMYQHVPLKKRKKEGWRQESKVKIFFCMPLSRKKIEKTDCT